MRILDRCQRRLKKEGNDDTWQMLVATMKDGDKIEIIGAILTINRKYETFVCSKDKADDLELTMRKKRHQFSKILKVNFFLSNAI